MPGLTAEWQSLRAPVQPPRPTAIIWQAAEAAYVPGATSAAIDFAAEEQLEWLCMTLARTQDGAVVVIGDDPAALAAIAQQSLADFKQLDAGAKLGPRFQGLRGLTLDEALAAARDRVNLLLICPTDEVAQAAAERVRAAGAQQQVLLELAWCQDWPSHCEARARWPEPLRAVGTLLSLPRIEPPPTGLVRDGNGPSAVGLPLSDSADDTALLTADRIGAWRQLGLGVVIRETTTSSKLTADVRHELLSARPDAIHTRQPGPWLVASALLANPHRRVQIAAHRGANRYAAENTYPAIELAAGLSMNWVEIDIQQAGDGNFYLMHDRKVDRTTNRQGLLTEFTGSQLAELDAGSWFGGVPAALPRLEEVLARFADDPALAGVNLYLDAKNIPPEKLAELVARYGLEERSMVFQAPAYLARVRAANPRIGLMPPLYQAKAVETLARQLQPTAFDVSWEILSSELIEQCHALGVKVFSDALGDHERVEDYRQAMARGIDVIQTDYPLRVWRAIELDAAPGAVTGSAP